jgi:hypothetical protein
VRALAVSEEREEEFLCVTPTFELVSKEDTLSRVLRTHTWQVEKAEHYGTDGFLTKIVCIKCGLQRIAIVSNIEESAKRASENRREGGFNSSS